MTAREKIENSVIALFIVLALPGVIFASQQIAG